MMNTHIPRAVASGVFSVLAIAQSPHASADPVTLTTDVMDRVSAGTDASSEVSVIASATTGTVNVVLIVDGVRKEASCRIPCSIDVANGDIKVTQGTASNQIVGSVVASATAISSLR